MKLCNVHCCFGLLKSSQRTFSLSTFWKYCICVTYKTHPGIEARVGFSLSSPRPTVMVGWATSSLAMLHYGWVNSLSLCDHNFCVQYFSQNYGMQPLIAESMMKKIGEVFNRSFFHMDGVCSLENKTPIKWKPLCESNGYLYYYNRFKSHPEPFLKNMLLDIGFYPNALFLYKENLAELKSEFQFKVSFTFPTQP